MAIPTPQKSMTETTASSYFLHGAHGLRRRMASNKLFVRLSVERRLGFSALRQGPHRRGRFKPTGATTRHYSPSLCGRAQRRHPFRITFSAFRALSDGEWHRRFRIARRPLVRTSSGLNWPSR
jgi:hypothetical protein